MRIIITGIQTQNSDEDVDDDVVGVCGGYEMAIAVAGEPPCYCAMRELCVSLFSAVCYRVRHKPKWL